MFLVGGLWERQFLVMGLVRGFLGGLELCLRSECDFGLSQGLLSDRSRSCCGKGLWLV